MNAAAARVSRLCLVAKYFSILCFIELRRDVGGVGQG